MLIRLSVLKLLNRYTEENSFTEIYVSDERRLGVDDGEIHKVGKKISTCWSRAFLFGPLLEQFYVSSVGAAKNAGESLR